MNTVGQLYVGVFALSGILCLAAITRARQFDDLSVRRGLVWLLATSGAWALLKTAFFVLPKPLREPAYIVGLAIGFATVWAWLYFCSAYTGQTYHRNRSIRRLSVVVFVSVVLVKVTNPIHGAYFSTTEVTAPFTYLAIEHNVLHWTATGLSYVLSAVGLFLIFQLFLESGYNTRPLSGLTALLGLPVVLDIGSQFTPWLIEVIYAPIGVAAFAIGVLFVFDRRFLAVQRTASSEDLSIYLDERGRIRDYTNAAREVIPELDGSTGDRLSAVAPDVTDVIDGDDQIIERQDADESEEAEEARYYFVSTGSLTLGDTGAQVIQLSDVTQTERQRRELAERERKLDEQNELYRAVIDASFAFVFRFDLDGRFTFVSPSIEEFLGYSPAELEGNQISATIPNEASTDRAWEQIEPVLNGESNKVRDFPLETAAGTTVFTDIRALPIYDGSVPREDRTPDDIIGVQLMVRDATERRQREGLISVINRVLRHNLRNRMNVITSYATMLEEKLDGDDATKARHIGDTADRLLDLSESAREIENNRDLSPDLEPIDIVPVLNRTVSQIQLQYPEAEITIEAPDTVVANTHERLETALWEVLDNAAKHGEDPPSVDIDVTVDDTSVAITVRDSGPGLPEMEQEVLRSNTETSLVHGDGLGLWLVYWIVTSLDGETKAESSSAGTAVTIRLPRYQEA